MAKKLLVKCENCKNNQYFYEYLLFCAVNGFLFEIKKCYYSYCQWIHVRKRIYSLIL